MEPLEFQLKLLRLSGMATSLRMRLQEADANDLPCKEFLDLLIKDELDRRKDTLLSRRLKAAGFPEMKTLDGFDFSFNSAVKKKEIKELASCRFIHDKRNVLFFGPPGVGKTHLAIAIGMSAIASGYSVLFCSIFALVKQLLEAEKRNQRGWVIEKLVKPQLLILDEFGMKNLSVAMADDLLEVFHGRYHNGSTIVTTNRPIEDWGKILGDIPATSAILDRFLEGIHFIKIPGKSYRMKELLKGKSAEEKAVTDEKGEVMTR